MNLKLLRSVLIFRLPPFTSLSRCVHCPWQIYFNWNLHRDPFFFPFHRQLSSCPIRHGAVICPWALVNQRLVKHLKHWFLGFISSQANVVSEVTSATIVGFPGSVSESVLLKNHKAWCKRSPITAIPIKRRPSQRKASRFGFHTALHTRVHRPNLHFSDW